MKLEFSRMHPKPAPGRAVFVVVALALVLAACKADPGGPSGPGGPGGPDAKGPPGKPGAMGGPPMAFSVETTEIKAESVGFSTTAVGTLEAFERVLVTARVAGVVDDVRFREGDRVQKGQVLVAIETERYALAVRAARAALERAQANLADAQAGLERRDAAEKTTPGLVRGEEVETYRARVETARADVAAATVQVDQALLNQRDAAVRAPMDGIIQTRDARTGQYAQPGALIATLLQRDPLLLRFSLPEADATSLKAGDELRFTLSGASAERTARVMHVAASADAATRMVPIVAEVADPASVLRAGAFAEIVVPLGAARSAPVVPQSAIRPSEKGFLAFVADGDKARERVVVLGQRTPDGRVEVREGLRIGEQLVVRGAEALREGAAIRLGGGASPARGGGPGGPPGEPGPAVSAPVGSAPASRP